MLGREGLAIARERLRELVGEIEDDSREQAKSA
jgi:hypothetical protein